MDLPIARVAVDVPLPHLDRPFDYAVPPELAASVTPGCRVRVRFAGRLVDGFVLARVAESSHEGPLAPVHRVVSAEPVLSPQVARLARAVADRWAGTLTDVLRLAVPPRHARVERATPGEPAAVPPLPGLGGWDRYDGGPALLADLAAGGRPRRVWSALPGPGWPAEVAAAMQATLAGGRGALTVVPDGRDVARVAAALDDAVGSRAFVTLTADLGPAERYRRFLRVRRGEVRAVVGTRAAAYAPVADLGLVVVWDDGDDAHAEQRAPYAHARDVLVLRAHLEGAAALVGGLAPSVEAQALLDGGWARPLVGHREAVRQAAPRVEVAVPDRRDPLARAARVPAAAFAAVRAALTSDRPVLVQVPRRGYQRALSCTRCGTRAHCRRCHGPLGRALAGDFGCGWCGHESTIWSCPTCGGREVRAGIVGDERTAEELARAFHDVPVVTSGGSRVLDRVEGGRRLVVATPGAEPLVDGGYGAALLLDAWAPLARPDLRAAEEALRRWCAAAALVRPAGDGGRVVLVGAEPGVPAVQALVRWSPLASAARESEQRAALGFPPATRLAALDGPPGAADALLAAADLPAGAEVLGPVPVPVAPGAADCERVLVRVPRAAGARLATSLAAAQRARRAGPDGLVVRVRLDPLQVG